LVAASVIIQQTIAESQARDLNEKWQTEKAARDKERQKEQDERQKQFQEERIRDRDVLKKRDHEGKIIERPKKVKPPEPEKVPAPQVKKVVETNQDGFQVEVTEIVDPVSQRIIKRITKNADQKGNMSNIVTVFDDKGSKTVIHEKTKPIKTVTRVPGAATPGSNQQVSASLLAANPFSAVLKADTVESPEELLIKRSEEIQKRNIEKELKAAQEPPKPEPEQPKPKEAPKPKAQQPAKKPQDNAAQKKADQPQPQRAEAPKPKAEQPKPKQPEQPKKQPEAPKQKPPADQPKPKQPDQPKPKQNQKQPAKKTGAQAKVKPQVAFWEDETLQPVLLLIAFLIVAAGLGYAISL